MNGYDPADYPDYSDAEPVCAKCFDDEDIADFIADFGGPSGCAFCGQDDAPTAPLDEVAEHMRECLERFYGYAVNQLPYETREGGYQGAHWSTFELVYDQLGLSLPRDEDDRLLFTLPDRISEEVWCDFDWLSLDYDEELNYFWERFCRTIQHERRFFFALPKKHEEEEPIWKQDDFSPLGLLSEIVNLAENFDVVQTLPVGMEIFRSRPCAHDAPYHTARDLGPPPPERAIQANRMNPPGIPMMYGAETEEIAVRETRSRCATVGCFRLERETRVLDLADLASVPGIFSGAERYERLRLIFIRAFSREISRPVDRTDRIHIDYIPSQVVTEFIRDAKIGGGRIDGIRYPSAVDDDGRNIVLFATPDDLMEPDGSPVSDRDYPPPTPWIRLIDSHLVEVNDAEGVIEEES